VTGKSSVSAIVNLTNTEAAPWWASVSMADPSANHTGQAEAQTEVRKVG